MEVHDSFPVYFVKPKGETFFGGIRREKEDRRVMKQGTEWSDHSA